MILEKIGTVLKKNIKSREWLIKVSVALVLSNIFFFLLFSGESKNEARASTVLEGWVEVQLEVQLLTPFQMGKKVLLVHRSSRKKIEGVLQSTLPDQLGKITVLVKEDEAHDLFLHDSWEVLPYLKHLRFSPVRKEVTHEIRY